MKLAHPGKKLCIFIARMPLSCICGEAVVLMSIYSSALHEVIFGHENAQLLR